MRPVVHVTNCFFFIFHCRYKLCEQRGNCAASFAYVSWCSFGGSYLILLKKVCYTFVPRMFDMCTYRIVEQLRRAITNLQTRLAYAKYGYIYINDDSGQSTLDILE